MVWCIIIFYLIKKLFDSLGKKVFVFVLDKCMLSLIVVAVSDG